MASWETQAPESGLTMVGELNAESSRKGEVPLATGTDNQEERKKRSPAEAVSLIQREMRRGGAGRAAVPLREGGQGEEGFGSDASNSGILSVFFLRNPVEFQIFIILFNNILIFLLAQKHESFYFGLEVKSLGKKSF